MNNEKPLDFNQTCIEFFLVGSGVSPIIGLISQSWEVFGIIVLFSLLGVFVSAMISNVFYTSRGDE